MTSDLRDILAIYFDLTDKPNGAKLMRGELQISEWIDTIISHTEERIPELKKYVKEYEGKEFEDTWKKRLDLKIRKLEKAKKYQEHFRS